MEEHIRDFYKRKKIYPTLSDFCNDPSLPSYARFKKMYGRTEINLVLAEIFGSPTYEELLLQHINGRDSVIFKTKELAKGRWFSAYSYARWLSVGTVEGYIIKKQNKPGTGGSYIAIKRK